MPKRCFRRIENVVFPDPLGPRTRIRFDDAKRAMESGTSIVVFLWAVILIDKFTWIFVIHIVVRDPRTQALAWDP